MKDLDQYRVGRLKSIDALRGIAALAVVIHHATTYGNYQLIKNGLFQFIASVLNHGHLGVPLFFVISGFCIHFKAADQLASGVQPRIQFIDFWKRRIFRLYPTYFVVLVLSMGLVLLAYFLDKDVAVLNIYPEPKLKWMSWDFISHAFMLHGFHPIFDKGGGNPPFWTLAREEYLYLLYGPLLFMRRRISMIYLIVLLSLLSILLYILGQTYLGEAHVLWGVWSSSALILWIQWAAGAYGVESFRGLTQIPKYFYSPLAIVIFATIAKISDSYVPFLSATLWAICFLALVMYCTQLEKNNQWPTTKLTEFFARLGVYSYSIYLVHFPVKGVMKQLVQPLGWADTLNPFLYMAVVAIITVICVLCSRVLFELIESKFLHKSKN